MDTFFIRVTPSTLELSSAGAVTGGLHVEIGDSAFPEEHWNDFVLITLGWWCDALREEKRQAAGRIELHFMDGPFEMHLFSSRAGEAFAVELRGGRDRRIQSTAEVPRVMVIDELQKASRAVLTYCSEKGVENEDVQTLRESLAALQARLPERG